MGRCLYNVSFVVLIAACSLTQSVRLGTTRSAAGSAQAFQKIDRECVVRNALQKL